MYLGLIFFIICAWLLLIFLDLWVYKFEKFLVIFLSSFKCSVYTYTVGLHIFRFCGYGFNQPWIENTIQLRLVESIDDESVEVEG